ncbi:MAG TPA: HAD family hydrolase [Thermomicrobiales bacterium]|nr:HAD family hydrolase [Thermomicrobiales bacterium]
MREAAPNALVLFEIYGTLLRAGDRAHQQAFVEAFEEVYGLPVNLEGVQLAGMLDANIARTLFELHELDHQDSHALLDKMMTSMGTRYRKAVMEIELRERLLPGVTEAITACSNQGWETGVLTGNARAVAYAKLERAGLADLLVTGAFGDSAQERGHLVETAILAAREATGFEYTAGRTVLVGDTPQDINAARESGSRVVAVATGRFDVHALAQHVPDALLPDLGDTRAFIQAVHRALGPA